VTKRKITMTIDATAFASFKQFCRSNGMKVSSRVELMMREFVENADDLRLKKPQQKQENGGGK
jgi:hypothetical protein